jgi:hypothetical protein
MPAAHEEVRVADLPVRGRLGAVVVLLLLTGCSADRIERGVFHSSKGYEVSLPPAGWQVEPDGPADLELRRSLPSGGMLADATCGGRVPERPLGVLARHLVFGLVNRSALEQEPVVVAGRSGVRTVVRGSRDGTEVAVEAVVLKGERCVYDFLYVAPVDHFEAGRQDFRTFVESFSSARRDR